MRITKHIVAIKEGLGNYLKSLEKENAMKLPENLPEGAEIETKGTIGLKLPYEAAQDLYNLLANLKEFRCDKILDRNSMMIFFPSDYEERVKKDILIEMAQKLYEEGFVRFSQRDFPMDENPDIASKLMGSLIVLNRNGDESDD